MAGRSLPWIERLFRVFGDDDVPGDNGVYSVQRNSLRFFNENESQFGESKVVERTPIIELNSTFGVSEPLRDRVVTNNGGSVDDINGTVTTGEILLSTGTNGTGDAKLTASEVGRYIPGYSAELCLGIRVPTAPTGDQNILFGGLTTDEQDGIYFGYDATGLYVARLEDGVETKVYQTDWNIDKLDGTGRTGISFSPSRGAVYQMQWTWYGYGQIVWGILGVINNKQIFIPVHQINNIVDFAGTSVADPSLRVTVSAKNNGTASNLETYVGGRQYSIVGRYIPKYRYTGDTRGPTALSTTRQPLVSFQHKTGFRNRSVKLSGFSVINNGNADVRIELYLGATLTGASFGTPNGYVAADTALESDVSATAVSGGNCVWAGSIIPAGQGSRFNVGSQELDLDLPEEVALTLCATAFTGTPSVTSALRMKEEW